MSDHSVYSPSSASEWLHCPASAQASSLEDNEDTAENVEGEVAHGLLEDALLFGTQVNHPDIEIVEGVELAVDYAQERLRVYGPECKLYVEKRLAIPGTEVWGTTDNLFVSPRILHVADFKYGWLPVEVDNNKQMLCYLAGAIAEFGPREEYYITVVQPRYPHRDGPIRTYKVTAGDLTEFNRQLEWAIANRDVFNAGKWCKYCKANGSCKTLADWLKPLLGSAIELDITNRHRVTDTQLAEMLDFLDIVKGWGNGVRAEAFKRALQSRKIGGYKIVKGKAERKVTNEAFIAEKFEEWGIPREALYEASLVSPLTIEKQLKATYRGHGRGVWKQYYDQLTPAIELVHGGMSLARETDARPQFNKGDEFGQLPEQGDILV